MSIKNDYFGITGLKDITVDIPLDIQSDNVGYKTLNEEEIAKIINFNLKSLIFTVPGERMDTNFGVGIKNYLFESADPTVFNQIQGAIEYQLRVYMPWLVETNVEVSGDVEYNTLNVRVKYKINRPEIVDYFEMSISLDEI
jgi:phage baseplate assembly protein W